MTMEIPMELVTDHGWPKASDGNDENAFEAFKNERDYTKQTRGADNTTVAAMDWAAREIERLTAENERLRAALTHLVNEVGASLPLMEPLCRREFGNTNYQCIMDRVAEARGILEQSGQRRLRQWA